jgi:hypothetical protein
VQCYCFSVCFLLSIHLQGEGIHRVEELNSLGPLQLPLSPTLRLPHLPMSTMERTFSPAPMGRLSRLQPLSHSFSSIQSLDGPQEQDSFGGSTVSGNSGSEEASGIDGHIQYFSLSLSLSLSHTHTHTHRVTVKHRDAVSSGTFHGNLLLCCIMCSHY